MDNTPPHSLCFIMHFYINYLQYFVKEVLTISTGVYETPDPIIQSPDTNVLPHRRTIFLSFFTSLEVKTSTLVGIFHLNILFRFHTLR